MPVDHQPTFSRTSLNVLILVCVVLILIFGQTGQSDSDIDMPPPPKLQVSIWQTDSGAQVWFNPLMTDKIHIQLHYLAGFGFNQAAYPAGTTQLLVNLLNHQARLQDLPIRFNFDTDFLEAELTLSTDALLMSEQIKRTKLLLLRPILDNETLQAAKQQLASANDALWQQAYAGHPYAGPKSGSVETLGGIHRGLLQKYQQSFMHPQRLSASIVGDLNEQAAQVIMESLLPASLYPASDIKIQKALANGQYQDASLGLVVLPGSYDHPKELASQLMLLEMLKQIQPTQMKLITGNTNNTLLVQQWPSLLSAMDNPLDSDMMREAKRQRIKACIEQSQQGQALSHLLVWLNRYHLPSNFLQQQFNVIKDWSEQDWQTDINKWLLPTQQ